MDQQALVAIGQRQHAAAPGDQPLQPPRAGIVAVQREAEIAGAAGVHRRLPPSSAQPRIGVQQQQPLATRRRHAGCQLRSPSTWRAQHTRPEPAASAGVPSLLPPSTTTTSSASATDASVPARVAAAFSVGITTDSMFHYCS